jgi:molybdopterin-binding protein
MNAQRFTRSQVAERMGVAAKTLYNWERAGKLSPPERDARGWRRYTAAHLDEIRALLGTRRSSPESRGGAVRPESPEGAPMLAFSARNCLRGIVTELTVDGVTAEVVIQLGGGQEIVAVITRRSAERLGLRVGEPAVAVIKATEVMVGR